MPPTQHYPSASRSEFPDAIKLTDFTSSQRTAEFTSQRFAPPPRNQSYQKIPVDANTTASVTEAGLLLPPQRPLPNRQATEHILAHLSHEKPPQIALAPPPSSREREQKEPVITPAKILREHVLARRKEQYTRPEEYDGDIVVDRLVMVVKTLTVVGLVFMIVWTAYKWWSLGPEYAPSETAAGSGSGSGGGGGGGR